jgi:pilus assembly protein CpaC
VAGLAGLLGICVLTAPAQEPRPKATGAGQNENQSMTVTIHHSVVLHAPWPTKRVAVTDPAIADYKMLTADSVMVMGKAIGSTDVMIWNEKEELFQVHVEVVADLEHLKKELGRLFPQSPLQVTQSQGVIVISGSLTRAEHGDEIRKFMDASKLKYVDLTSVAGVQQVRIKVRVAEVSRTAIRTLAVNGVITQNSFALASTGGPGGSTTLQPITIGVPAGASAVGQPQLQFPTGTVSGATDLFLGIPDARLQLFIQALAENQYLRILSEPTLVALSGEEASFLVGGEIPIPVPQASGGTTPTITIEYKEYGIHLRFRPTVLGDNTIRLYVAPEVSELTSTGAVVLQGFSIPAFLTRKAQTTLELHSGQTFAMAGLISNNVSADNSRVPGLGDVPVLGSLFRSASFTRGEAELVVMVTASLVEPLSTTVELPLPGELNTDPNDWELYGLGLIQGQEPPKISPAQMGWLKEKGLDRLLGPGAWEREDGPAHHAARRHHPTTAPASDGRKH